MLGDVHSVRSICGTSAAGASRAITTAAAARDIIEIKQMLCFIFKLLMKDGCPHARFSTVSSSVQISESCLRQFYPNAAHSLRARQILHAHLLALAVVTVGSVAID